MTSSKANAYVSMISRHSVSCQATSFASVVTYQSRSDHFEIDGDEIRPLDYIELLGIPEDDTEDLYDLIARLPLVEVNKEQHFTKKGNHRSESGWLVSRTTRIPTCNPAPRTIRQERARFRKAIQSWLAMGILRPGNLQALVATIGRSSHASPRSRYYTPRPMR